MKRHLSSDVDFGMVFFGILAAAFFVAIGLAACDRIGGAAEEASPYDFKCDDIEGVYAARRCVNPEVVCYLVSLPSPSISCVRREP